MVSLSSGMGDYWGRYIYQYICVCDYINKYRIRFDFLTSSDLICLENPLESRNM